LGPIINGLFYFIAIILSLELDSSFRHEDSTGCIYDFLAEKTAVDIGMKTGRLCKECRNRVEKLIQNNKNGQNIIHDIDSILSVVSKLSKIDKSIFKSDDTDKFFDWSSFENEIARIYKELGADVKQNVTIAGFQVDMLIQQMDKNSKKINKLIECKYSENPITNSTLISIQRMVEALKKEHLIETGIVVSKSGFTTSARSLAKKINLELVTYKELLLSIRRKTVLKGIIKKQNKNNKGLSRDLLTKANVAEIKSRNIFVIIPFTKEMEDVFFLGIRDTAEKMNYSCEKVDTKKFVGPILTKIYDSIRDARVVIAEVSKVNANVYYELGYAHALEKPTILIAKNMKSSPFDTKGFNHLIYVNLVDLQNQLKETLKAVLVDR
jgi:hypothetical protein